MIGCLMLNVHDAIPIDEDFDCLFSIKGVFGKEECSLFSYIIGQTI